MSTSNATSRDPQPDLPAPHWPPGWHVRSVAETGSTNTDLLVSASAGAPDRSVLVAAHQTAGRGRLDRTWEAPPGANLLASLLFRDVPADVHELTQRLALAAVDAVRVVAGIEAVLKWPNDLLVDDAKLAGVLAQTAAVGGRIDHVVVGIGLNVGWSPPGAACLGEVTTPAAVLSALLVAYDQLPVDIYPRYRAALGTIGRQVRIEATGGVTLGRAVDVDRDGRLVVIDECAISHRIDTGDVVHLRPG